MEAILAHCNAAFAGQGGLLLAFFIGGLTGGFTHCLVMCGPFVACERACSNKGCSVTNNLSLFLGLPYHIGRMVTYGALGFFVALVSKQVAAYDWWHIVSSIMLSAAGILFLFSCLKSYLRGNVFQKNSSLTYLRGMLLGFMPCGLLYAALMMAATLIDPVKGMVAMWIFTLGTMPALLLAGGSADFLSRKWQPVMHSVGCVMMAFNGVSLLILAARIL